MQDLDIVPALINTPTGRYRRARLAIRSGVAYIVMHSAGAPKIYRHEPITELTLGTRTTITTASGETWVAQRSTGCGSCGGGSRIKAELLGFPLTEEVTA